tara:strand:- start:4 stop:678 length:675 start_codon:yes stop_codon:yes gene_type:complete
MVTPFDEAFALIESGARGSQMYPAGSTGARRYNTSEGSFVGKRGAHPQHVMNEFDMNQYLNALGVGVPEAQLRHVGDSPLMLTRFEEGAAPVNFQRDREQLREDYVPHAAIGNWDVIGMEHDNVLHRPSGRLTYVDLGGTGDFRAQGGAKANIGQPFTGQVNELDTLQEHNRDAFGRMSEQDMGRSFDIYGGEDAMTQALNAIRNPMTRNVMQQRVQDIARRVA